MKMTTKHYLFAGITAGVLYNIIRMLWQMAEVKLYGFSQVSMIDSLAAVFIAVVGAIVLTLWAWLK